MTLSRPVRSIRPLTAIALAIVLVSCAPSLTTSSPSPSPTPTATPTAAATPTPTATATPTPTASPRATFAASTGGTCTSAAATPRQVLVRLFALSTSGDAKAATDCYAAPYRARSASFDSAMAMWVQDGPATDVVIRFIDTVKGCDRFHATARMSAESFWMRGQGGGSQFFMVGPDVGGPRIYETGTGLAAAEYATAECRGSANAGLGPTVSRAVDVCGSLLRFISDGNTRLAQLQVAGAVTEYRLQAGYGTSERDPASGIAYPARITGSEVLASTGSAQAINLVDYTLARVGGC